MLLPCRRFARRSTAPGRCRLPRPASPGPNGAGRSGPGTAGTGSTGWPAAQQQQVRTDVIGKVFLFFFFSTKWHEEGGSKGQIESTPQKEDESPFCCCVNARKFSPPLPEPFFGWRSIFLSIFWASIVPWAERRWRWRRWRRRWRPGNRNTIFYLTFP